jgi:hypothetical protein
MIEVSRVTSSGGGGRRHQGETAQGETARGGRSGEGPVFDPSPPSGCQDRARTSSGTALPAGASIETVARWS